MKLILVILLASAYHVMTSDRNVDSLVTTGIIKSIVCDICNSTWMRKVTASQIECMEKNEPDWKNMSKVIETKTDCEERGDAVISYCRGLNLTRYQHAIDECYGKVLTQNGLDQFYKLQATSQGCATVLNK